MLPDPTIAAVTLGIALPFEGQGDVTEPGERGPELVTRPGVDRAGTRTGQDDVAGVQPYAETRDGPGEPGDGGDRVAQHRVGAPLGDQLGAPPEFGVDAADVDRTGCHPGGTEHEAGRRGVVGDRVGQADPPVDDPAV